MKVASLFSGGKDSTYALWYAQMQGWDVERLVTVFPEAKDSWMFHYPAVKWTSLQAEAIGIPQVHVPTAGVKEEELEDLRGELERLKKSAGIEAIVSGAIASEYQRTRLDNLCEKLGLRSFAPLWHKNETQLVRDEIEAGFEIIVTACSALGLDERWLGKTLSAKELKELLELRRKYGLSVAFEGGEAETFTLGGPVFKRRLSVTKSARHWAGDSGYLELDEVRLV
ncbi:MAG: diphthine--ammonia ligase [Candidatus Bathyarchaeia archaeon]|jgi:ABC transporter with metal-binding/Fe-S-binding domain ATP-binding protein